MTVRNALTSRFIVPVIFLLGSPSYSQDLSAFEKQLQKDSGIETKESIEIHDGVRYRKVETTNGRYYLKLSQRNDEISEIECGKPKGFKSDHLVEVSVKVFRRTQVFARALKEACTIEKGRKKPVLVLESEIGIALPDQPGDVVKDKKIKIDPLNPKVIGVGGSF